MPKEKNLQIIRQGVVVWNEWRQKNRESVLNLSETDLSRADLSNADLSGVNLRWADLRWADLFEVHLNKANLRCAKLASARLIRANLSGADLLRADLSRANLSGADLSRAELFGANLGEADLCSANFSRANLNMASLFGANLSGGADLSGTNLTQADLTRANLRGARLSSANLTRANLTGANLTLANLTLANLTGANLTDANLTGAQLIETDLRFAKLIGSKVYGVSVWNIKVDDLTKQQNLIITNNDEPVITVDNIKVAQFIYMLLNNQEIREVIDTITSKGVLILGRFTEDRKAVLDALREELRKHDYLPILFDFDVPGNRDITETVSLLARMARFIIADLTDPSSIPKELEAIVPSLAVPVQPLLEGLARPYAMFKDYWKYDWVLKPYRYEGIELLLAALAEKVIAPAEAKAKALEERRRALEVELTAPRTSA